MTPENLKQVLDKKYQLCGFTDLADLTSSPVSAFKFFKSAHQAQFEPKQRIVIYTSRVIDNQVIDHLYQITNFVDISNWFVLICSTTDVSTQLLSVCQTSSSDSVPFQNLVVPLNGTKDLGTNFTLPNSLCAIPWSNLEIKQDGDITPCCTSTYNFGNIRNDRLEDVFNGPGMTKLRQQLIEGQLPVGCNACWNREKQGLISIRQHNAKRLKESFMLRYFDKPRIATIDLKFQNTCNFKCRICGPACSSLYAEEQSKYTNIKITPQLPWSEEEKFISQMHQLLPDLNNIDMYGGEPFLIKKFSKVLKTAVDTGVAKNIRLHYNSNGSVWPERFIPYWSHFKQVDIHFSIDAVGHRFELQRGGLWQEVEKNILRIKNLNFDNLSISIMPTVSIMNVFYIDEVLEWAHSHKFPVFLGHVTTPTAFALSSLTQEAKDLIVKKFTNSPWAELQELSNAVQLMPATTGQPFCQKTQWFDSIRKENFSDTHPEIAKAMGYIKQNEIILQRL